MEILHINVMAMVFGKEIKKTKVDVLYHGMRLS